MILIDGGLGDFIGECKDAILYEVGGDTWDWETYLGHVNDMQTKYEIHISEFIGGSKSTIGLNDLSIIALGKTLGVPVLSMESRVPDEAVTMKRRIPNICDHEGVVHVSISEFLRIEKFSF